MDHDHHAPAPGRGAWREWALLLGAMLVCGALAALVPRCGGPGTVGPPVAAGP